MGGDFRALSFCCKPGHSLTFAGKCLRDETLKQIGLSPEEFILIKTAFSLQHGWDAPEPCFGSLSYCCMRQSGCNRRDTALINRYPEDDYPTALGEYFRLKRLLAAELLKKAKNQQLVKELIEE